MALCKKVFIFLLFLSMPVAARAVEGEAIRLLFGGDVTLGAAYPEIAPDAMSDFYWPFKRLEKVVRTADIFMVNCENPITAGGKKAAKKFNFKMDPLLVNVLKSAGINIVSLANNHVMDFGVRGLADTIKFLREAGIKYVGAGVNLYEARRAEVIEVRGKRIAFLAYGNYSPATNDRPGVAYRNPAFVKTDVASAKAKGADLVVVNFHWGKELAKKPEHRDVLLARQAVDSGADVVIGHHPHVVQAVERYKQGIIAYSLGNFIFGGNRRGARDSILLMITFDGQGQIAYEKIPIRIDPQETRYQPYIL